MMTRIGHGKDIVRSNVVIRAPKKEARPMLGFKLGDLEGVVVPHNDILIIRATIANFDEVRVFVGIGSLVNILFWMTLDQMRIKVGDLQSITTPLFGFSGHAVQSLGQIKLSLSLGEET